MPRMHRTPVRRLFSAALGGTLLVTLGLAPAFTGVAAADDKTPPVVKPTDGTPDGAAKKVDGPSVDEIFANYVKAIGGKEKLGSHTSRRMTGRFEMNQMPGMAMAMVMEAHEPNMLLMTITIPQMGEMRQGYDGKIGWSMDPMQGPMLMPEEQLVQFRREANFRKELDLKAGYKDAEMIGRGDFEGRPVWQVKLTDEAGDRTTMHFGVEDHLLWGMSMVNKTPMGEMPTRSVIKEYRDFDGIKTAAIMEIHTMGMVQTMTVDKIEFDVVDKSVFTLPPAIQSLVDASKEREKAKEPAPAGS